MGASAENISTAFENLLSKMPSRSNFLPLFFSIHASFWSKIFVMCCTRQTHVAHVKSALGHDWCIYENFESFGKNVKSNFYLLNGVNLDDEG